MVDFELLTDLNQNLMLNNRYLIKKKIGEGSYGVVWEAEDTKKNNNLVAIKQLSKSRLEGNAYLIESLKKELEIMKLVSHKNSVKLIEHFETKEKHNIVMELCDADLDFELKKHCKEKEKAFSELEVFYIMTQFNEVLKKLYENKVIHRDLKLKNILVKYDKKAPEIGFIIKLSDFGFSKVMNEDNITSTNLGSPVTKAPEIMSGKDYNSKADLWSVGVIMFQLLYNQLPFPANNIRELQRAIFTSNGVKLPEPNKNPISNECYNLINNLLQKDPQNRIDFYDYFNHEFFSEGHKELLIKKKNEQNSEKNNNSDSKNIKNINELFFDLRSLSENYGDYNIYKAKAKDPKNGNLVTIKEISIKLIDENERNQKIFEKEIKLLHDFNGKLNFPKFFGWYKTETHYYIVIEYFSGNILGKFIKSHQKLKESLVGSILDQLKHSFNELNKNNIILQYISPNNFAFSYYHNESDFQIKFFDYGLNSIFTPDLEIKRYLLDEAKLGEVKDAKTNILSLGLSVYKMLFGKDRYIFKDTDIINEKNKEVGCLNGQFTESCNKFLLKCITNDINKRYDWKSLLEDDFLMKNIYSPKNPDSTIIKEISDNQIENMLEIKKIHFDIIISYFKRLLKDQDKNIDKAQLMICNINILLFIKYCELECKIIKNFLLKNQNKKEEPTNQEIHLLIIKGKNEYDYSFATISDYNNKKSNIYHYNTENPFLEKYAEKFKFFYKEFQNIYLSAKNSFCSLKKENSHINDTNTNDEENDEEMPTQKDISDYKELNKEVNLNNLFDLFFGRGVFYYNLKEYENSFQEFIAMKYLAEIRIFRLMIFGEAKESASFEEIFEKLSESSADNDNNHYFIFTFLGSCIKNIYIQKYKGDDKENSAIEKSNSENNIKVYNTLIDYYHNIDKLIEKSKEGNKRKQK